MQRLADSVLLSLSLLLSLVVGLQPLPSTRVGAQQTTVVYNLYATDGYYELNDGQPLYLYGLVGGQEGQDLTYQTHCSPGQDPLTGMVICSGSTNVTVAGGPAAPQAGPWAGQDAGFAGNAQFPAPILYARVGDVVEIRLKNLGAVAGRSGSIEPTNIHLHALDINTAGDGTAQNFLEAVPANLCSDGTTAGPSGCGAVGPAPGAGNVIVYMFSPTHAGTYLYYCHPAGDSTVQMAAFGALVIYNSGDAAAEGGPGHRLGGTLYNSAYDSDYVLLLGEFDVHDARKGGSGSQAGSINGLSFPQTIHAAFPSGYPFSQWLAAHRGYDPMIRGSTGTASTTGGTPGQKVLIRVLNVSLRTQAMHASGYRGQILGSDQRGWFWIDNVPFSESMETDTLRIGSGETYDWLIDLDQLTGEPGAPEVAGDGGSIRSHLPYIPLYDVEEGNTSNESVYPDGMFTFLVPGP
jgi:FtsP/CotA-like multicopper oxidase with cupredoxin domain